MSDKKTERLTIRLLKGGKEPSDAIRGGVTLHDWPVIDGARIALGSTGQSTPRWAHFLGLSTEQASLLENSSAFGVVFLKAVGRWFAISFGLGHVKLDPACVEHDFGLRVVLNSVDPAKLRSADLRTPDENSLTKRTQTSRRSSQEAFNIDPERDIVRGLAGEPRDKAFGSKVAGRVVSQFEIRRP